METAVIITDGMEMETMAAVILTTEMATASRETVAQTTKATSMEKGTGMEMATTPISNREGPAVATVMSMTCQGLTIVVQK